MYHLGLIPTIVQIWRRFPTTLRLLFKRGIKWQVRALIIVALVYLFMPFDLIPEWIIGLGIVDDFVIVTALFGLADRLEQSTTLES